MSLLKARHGLIAGAATIAVLVPWRLAQPPALPQVPVVEAMPTVLPAVVTGDMTTALATGIFASDRLPEGAVPPPVTDAAAPPAPAAAVPQLVGVVMRNLSTGVALVRAGDGSTKTLKTGETVDGWVMTTLRATRATFVQNGQSADAVLGFPNRPAKAAAAAQAIPVPPPEGAPLVAPVPRVPSPGTAPSLSQSARAAQEP